MNTNDFERLSFLSEKSLLNTITPDEFEEFRKLLISWNESTENKLLQGLYVPSPKGFLF